MQTGLLLRGTAPHKRGRSDLSLAAAGLQDRPREAVDQVCTFYQSRRVCHAKRVKSPREIVSRAADDARSTATAVLLHDIK